MSRETPQEPGTSHRAADDHPLHSGAEQSRCCCAKIDKCPHRIGDTDASLTCRAYVEPIAWPMDNTVSSLSVASRVTPCEHIDRTGWQRLQPAPEEGRTSVGSHRLDTGTQYRRKDSLLGRLSRADESTQGIGYRYESALLDECSPRPAGQCRGLEL